jgi:hypothetical protein
MATNKYFQRGKGVGSTSEQDLIEKTIIETIQMAGTDFNYILRDQVKQDRIFNEDPLAQFTGHYTIEMYVNNTTNFGGQGHLLDKFGLDVQDTIDLVVSKKRIFEELGRQDPQEGDLIYWPLTKSLFKINYVEDEMEPYYMFSGLYVFNLKCSRFDFSYEDFDTGIKEVDDRMVGTVEIPFEKNDDINDEANDILDFSEENPFGDVTEHDSNT